MTIAQAIAVAARVARQADWLECRVAGNQVVLGLAWPRGHTRLIREYRRSVVDAAVDELVAISEAYWAHLLATECLDVDDTPTLRVLHADQAAETARTSRQTAFAAPRDGTHDVLAAVR